MWAGLSAIRLYLQGIRACGPDAERARWAARQGRGGRNLRRLNGVMRKRWGGDSGNLAGGEVCNRGPALHRFSGEIPARNQTVRAGLAARSTEPGQKQETAPRVSASKSRVGRKVVLPVFAPGEADYPASLAPVTPQS